VNARAGGTAAHTLHATTLTTAEPTKWFTVAIGMFRGPIEMDVGDGLAVMRRSR
jgi:hypothetical protein